MSQHAYGRPEHRGPRTPQHHHPRRAKALRILRIVLALYLAAAAIGGLLAGDWFAAALVGVAAALVWPRGER